MRPSRSTTARYNCLPISSRQTWQRESHWICRESTSKRASIWQRPLRKPRPPPKFRLLRTMAVSYAFEHNADDAAKYERQAFDLQFSAKQFADAGGTADELARIYLESGDPDNAFQWYQSGHLTAMRQPNLSPAERDLWEFRWESALARIRVRRTRQGRRGPEPRGRCQSHIGQGRQS